MTVEILNYATHERRTISAPTLEEIASVLARVRVETCSELWTIDRVKAS